MFSYKKRKRGVGIKQISIIKKCTVRTVHNNKHKFDIIPNTKPHRYEFNDKIICWIPEYEKGIKRKALGERKL